MILSYLGGHVHINWLIQMYFFFSNIYIHFAQCSLSLSLSLSFYLYLSLSLSHFFTVYLRCTHIATILLPVQIYPIFLFLWLCLSPLWPDCRLIPIIFALQSFSCEWWRTTNGYQQANSLNMQTNEWTRTLRISIYQIHQLMVESM